MQAFFGARTENTLRAYRESLEDFRAFLGATSINEAVSRLLSKKHGDANAMALAYKINLRAERRLAPSTVNARLAALRSIVKLGRQLGMVAWALEVEAVKAKTYRDTQGCGEEKIAEIVQLLEKDIDQQHSERRRLFAIRDRAMILLMYSQAMRRFEITRMNLSDIDLANKAVRITGKGESQDEPRSIDDHTAAALEAWIKARPETPSAALFLNPRKQRLTPNGLSQVCERIGMGHPHGARHTAITKALDLYGGDYRKVQRFSRHKDIRTIMKYDDNRADLAGEVAKRISDSLKDKTRKGSQQ